MEAIFFLFWWGMLSQDGFSENAIELNMFTGSISCCSQRSYSQYNLCERKPKPLYFFFCSFIWFYRYAFSPHCPKQPKERKLKGLDWVCLSSSSAPSPLFNCTRRTSKLILYSCTIDARCLPLWLVPFWCMYKNRGCCRGLYPLAILLWTGL